MQERPPHAHPIALLVLRSELLRRVASASFWLTFGCLSRTLAAESYQPTSHVTRGIYAHIHRVIRASVWDSWGSGFEFVTSGAERADEDRPHGGEACVRCVGEAGTRGQGVGQSVELNQTKPKAVKIAGWSRCQDVKADKNYTYSLYVDLTFADGESWPMKVAAFETGTHDWQYAETVVTPPKPLARARFYAFIREIDGTVWFDDLFFGEAGGRNLLRCPGFEKDDRVDLAGRRKLFADLEALHCNAVHGYLSGALKEWDEPPSEDSETRQFLEQAHKLGIGVWLTVGLGTLPVKSADDPDFPQYYCVNGDWGRRWTGALAKVARYPFAGLSMVPDEYNWNNSRLKRAFAKHADPEVRDFYAKLGTYCDCPVCRGRFADKYGASLPQRIPRGPPTATLRSSSLRSTSRSWLRFRYDSTTDWLRRSCAAVKRANPDIRTDSLICVTPLCSDFWYGPGIAWDRAGHEAGLEYATTDPYIQLHNYLGDSTHWYVTETTEHLAAAGPKRRCGIVLEASRLRPEYREFDPVEIYGSALSAVWHGADELAWWHHTHVMDISHTTDRPEVSRACVSGVYGLLERIDPWLDGLTPEPGVALLFSRASCDMWRLYIEAKSVQAKAAGRPFDKCGIADRGITDPRYASIVQKEALYLLLRTGVPTTVYYLEAVRRDEIAGHDVIVVPFPLAISEEKARLLEGLARGGKRVVLMGIDGPLDQAGAPHERPVLFDLIRGDRPVRDLEGFLARSGGEVHTATCGKGSLSFTPPELLDRLASNRDNEKRTRKERILPSSIHRGPAALVAAAILRAATGPGARPLMTDRLPEGDDVELCVSVNRRGEKLFLAINWDGRKRSVTLPERACFDRPPREAYLLGPDGRWGAWKGSFRPELRLKAQQALVARLAAR